MAHSHPNSTFSAARARPRKRHGSWRKGLNVENTLTSPSRGENFLLTFPFIEPVRHDVIGGLFGKLVGAWTVRIVFSNSLYNRFLSRYARAPNCMARRACPSPE